MNDSDVAKLIQETNQGEQNRYGDIEYKLPVNQRVSNLEVIAEALAPIDPRSKALNGLPSLIYWALCDEITIVNACVSAFVPLADHPRVAGGGTNYTKNSRISNPWSAKTCGSQLRSLMVARIQIVNQANEIRQ